MAEYIDRVEYCEKHCRCNNEKCERQRCPIWKAPAADVAPVRHGKWMPFHAEFAGDIQYCSVCEIGFAGRTAYCPHCGAVMDGWRLEGEEND